MEQRLCEVWIRFKVTKEQIKHVYEACEALGKIGITFDTGSCCKEIIDYDKEIIYYDWEFDWSLEGPIEVRFKRFKEDEKQEAL